MITNERDHGEYFVDMTNTTMNKVGKNVVK